ncbi:Na/Pi symporter, partial [Paenibacillus polymyxa]
SHVLLNVGGALLFMPLIPGLDMAASWISTEPGAKVAHAQTLFNVISSLLALPLCYLPAWTRIEEQVSSHRVKR